MPVELKKTKEEQKKEMLEKYNLKGSVTITPDSSLLKSSDTTFGLSDILNERVDVTPLVNAIKSLSIMKKLEEELLKTSKKYGLPTEVVSYIKSNLIHEEHGVTEKQLHPEQVSKNVRMPYVLPATYDVSFIPERIIVTSENPEDCIAAGEIKIPRTVKKPIESLECYVILEGRLPIRVRGIPPRTTYSR
jgi:uncharacterized protein YxjI